MTTADVLTDTRGVTAAADTTKARIERAALLLFGARGVDAVTTREIAAASHVSEGALYRHYPSKEALAQTMFFAIHKKLAAEMQRAAADAPRIEDKARAIVSAYCRIADEDWALFSYHLLTTHRFLPYADKPADRRMQHDNPVAVVEAVVGDAMKAGDLPAGDASFKAAAALGVVLQTALHKVYGRIDGALSAREAELTRAVIAVLKS
jgi:AcrR family transcriptional regulator